MKRQLQSLLLSLGALGCLGSTASAQLSLEWSSGVLGASVGFEVEGPAGEIFALMPSLFPGPTPLGLVSPGDPRVLSVGLDQISVWEFGILAGAGTPSKVLYPMPNSPALAGTIFYAQALTFPGAIFFVNNVSNPVSWATSFRSGFQRTTTDMVNARRWHTSTTLDDGRVLLAGGYDDTIAVPQVISSWEIFEPSTQSFVPGGVLPEPRARHTATKLRDGRILLIGGVNTIGNALSSTVLIDPTGTVAVPGPTMPALRVHHTATLLNNGRVLVVGGTSRSTVGRPLGFPASFQFQGVLQSHIFDPVNNSWLPGPALPRPIIGHGAALVGDGRCVIAGGISTGGGGGTRLAVLLYDPLTNLFTPTAPLPEPLAFLAVGPKANGSVFAVGGADIDLGALTVVGSNRSYTYTILPGAPASTGTWSQPTMIGPNGTYIAPKIICLPGGSWPAFGQIIIIDGVIYIIIEGYSDVDLQTGTAVINDHLHTTDPMAVAWTDVGSMLSMRDGMDTSVIDDSLRLLLSGTGLAPGGLLDLRGETWVR